MEPIQEAKRRLEQKIILYPDVFGIGTCLLEGESYIEIAVKDQQAKAKILAMLTNNKWEGYQVRIIIREQTKVL